MNRPGSTHEANRRPHLGEAVPRSEVVVEVGTGRHLREEWALDFDDEGREGGDDTQLRRGAVAIGPDGEELRSWT